MKISQRAMVPRSDLGRWLRTVPTKLLYQGPSPEKARSSAEFQPAYLTPLQAYELRIDYLIAISCSSNEEALLVGNAFQLALEGHGCRTRRSGEPYIEHPLAVAESLADLGFEAKVIAAALCHDLIEDEVIEGQRVTRQYLAGKLGVRVARLIDGVTELGKEPGYLGQKPPIAEVFKKFFEFGSKDLAVVFIKLADRLHNMRTLAHMPREKQIGKSRETLHIYAPLADILGLWEIKRELEDLSFQYLEPKTYQEIEIKRAEIVAASEGLISLYRT